MNEKLKSAREKVILEQRQKCVDMYKRQVEELLRTAVDYFIENPAKKKVVLKVPNKSKEFWTALHIIAANEEWDLWTERVRYSPKRVLISTEWPRNPIFSIG